MSAAAVEFQPHRKWFRRPEVVGPVLLTLLAYAVIIMLIEEPGRVRTRMTAEGTEDFDWMYFWHLVPLMFTHLLITIKGTLLGFTVSIVLGFLMALGRRSGFAPLAWFSALIIEFIRSTPLLVQLYFILYLSRATDAFSMAPLTILMVGLGVHYATYCSEAYRAGINSVPKGQWEAATALNLDPVTKWTRVIIPQAVPNVLPALGNYLVAGFKDAPVAFIVGVQGILFFANAVRGTDFRTVEPYILVGIGFLIASLPAAWAVRRLEEKIAYERT